MTTTKVHALRGTEPAVSLVERLIAVGLIGEEQLQVALREQRRQHKPIGRILVELGLISESLLRDTLAELLEERSVDPGTVIPETDALKILPKRIARRYNVLPICWDASKHVLTLAVSDTSSVATIDQVAARLDSGVAIATLHAGEAEIKAAIDRFYSYEWSIPAILHEIDVGKIDTLEASVEAEDDKHPLIRLVDAILADAVKRDASDIHFEPELGFLRVRYRIDGVMQHVMSLHRNCWPGMTARLMVMSNMNDSESRSAQVGQFSRTLAGRQIELRVSRQATIHGENFVLRIHERCKDVVPLENLDLRKEALVRLQLMMARPEGIIIVAGPPRSGKTTTLCSMLNYRNDDSVNIFTLENAVEYRMAMTQQISLDEATDIDEVSGIQSLLLQNPDVIMVGDVADKEMAMMAFRAAITGHQVFITLRAKSALAAVPRLVDFGVQAQIMAGNIIGIVAQRLVRRLCSNCKQGYEASEVERDLLGISQSGPIHLYREGACGTCNFLGYKGRIGVFEVLRINAALDEMIGRTATCQEMRKAALADGFEELAEDAIRQVLNGTTSLSEISRVVDLTARVG
jgi:general secretion pathway protein E/type IV pilus assembly protein PilB